MEIKDPKIRTKWKNEVLKYLFSVPFMLGFLMCGQMQ